MNSVLEISKTQLNEDMTNGNAIGREGRKTDSKKCDPPNNNVNGNMSLNLKKMLF